MEASLKLIRAYLTLHQHHSGSGRGTDATSTAKCLRAALGDKTVLHSIIASFKCILDVQLEGSGNVISFRRTSSDSTSKALIVVVDNDKDSHGTHTRASSNGGSGSGRSSVAAAANQLSNYKYLNETTAAHAMEALRDMGTILGPKHTAWLVDACVADLYEAAEVMAKASRNGHAQQQWLHEWMGVVRLVPPLLRGSFVAAGQDKHNKKAQRRRKYLVSLAESILPLITSHPLWSLPTMDGSVTGGVFHNEGLPRTSNNSQPNVVVPELKQQLHPQNTATASTLRGNAVILCGLMDVIGTLIDLADDNLSSCLTPILLYPLLEKVGQQQHQQQSVVRDAAWSVLEKLAVATCGCSDVSLLIADNWESSLVNNMLGKIRVPGGRSLVPGEEPDDNVCTVVDCATAVFRISAASIQTAGPHQQPPRDRSPQTMLTNVRELTRELTTRFDYGSTKVTTKGFPVVAFKFVSLFDAAVTVLRAARESSGERHAAIKDVAEPWFDLLTPFRKEKQNESKKGAYHP